MKVRRIKQVVISMALAILLALSILPSLPVAKNSTFATAGMFCSKLGTNMDSRLSINTDKLTAPNVTARKWTVQELFDSSIAFTTYNGEGKDTFWLADTEWRTKQVSDWTGDVKNKSEAKRNVGDCYFGPLTSDISTMMINTAGGLVNIAQFFIVRLYSGDVICTSPDSPKGACINIIGIVGGAKGKTGIIGSLRDSIFSPLATLMFILVGVWILYKGLFKREFRASMMGLLWSLGVFIFGLIALNKPAMLAGAPQTINSALSTCLMGAMNGQSCVTGTVTAPSTIVGTECESYGTSAGTEGAAMATNALTCSLWKSFVLDAWSRGEFGYNYNELYLKDAPTDGTVWANAPDDVTPFSVNMKSSGATPTDGSKIETAAVPINNLALYQLYISTDMKSSGDTQWKNTVTKGQDLRWYNIIKAASKDDRMWNHWTPNSVYGVKRIGTAFVSLVMTGIVCVLLAVTSFWGLVYMFAGSLLMAFAPFFLLIAIEPGKGRRIFLGWLESVSSSILKYMASALMVLVALSLYAAILSSTSNYISSFIGVTIMTGVLMMYRKEIINLLGMTSLGGQKLSNAVGERLAKKGKKAKEFAKVVGGSAIGGAIAEGQNGGNVLSGFGTGLKEGTGRQLRRGNSLLSGIARQSESVNRAHTKANSDKEREEKQVNVIDEKLNKAKDELNQEFDKKTKELEQSFGTKPKDENDLGIIKESINKDNDDNLNSEPQYEGGASESKTSKPKDQVLDATKNVKVKGGINVSAEGIGGVAGAVAGAAAAGAVSGAIDSQLGHVPDVNVNVPKGPSGPSGPIGSRSNKTNASVSGRGKQNVTNGDNSIETPTENNNEKLNNIAPKKGKTIIGQGYKGRHDEVRNNDKIGRHDEVPNSQVRPEPKVNPQENGTPVKTAPIKSVDVNNAPTPQQGNIDLKGNSEKTQSTPVTEKTTEGRTVTLPEIDKQSSNATPTAEPVVNDSSLNRATPNPQQSTSQSNVGKVNASQQPRQSIQPQEIIMPDLSSQGQSAPQPRETVKPIVTPTQAAPRETVKPTVTPTQAAPRETVRPTVTPTQTAPRETVRPTVTPTQTAPRETVRPTVTPTQTAPRETVKPTAKETPQNNTKSTIEQQTKPSLSNNPSKGDYRSTLPLNGSKRTILPGIKPLDNNGNRTRSSRLPDVDKFRKGNSHKPKDN